MNAARQSVARSLAGGLLCIAHVMVRFTGWSGGVWCECTRLQACVCVCAFVSMLEVHA